MLSNQFTGQICGKMRKFHGGLRYSYHTGANTPADVSIFLKYFVYVNEPFTSEVFEWVEILFQFGDDLGDLCMVNK